jgi:hypothetical protein
MAGNDAEAVSLHSWKGDKHSTDGFKSGKLKSRYHAFDKYYHLNADFS